MQVGNKRRNRGLYMAPLQRQPSLTKHCHHHQRPNPLYLYISRATNNPRPAYFTMNDSASINIPLSSPLPMGYQRPSAGRPPIIEQLRAEVRGVPYRPAARKKTAPQPPGPDEVRRLFTVETGSRWMDLGERSPAAKMLFGEFWHQGELSILFADTNAGKSVLAVQIANNIARARQTGPFACSAKPERVLYVDFELTTTQFYQRYSNPKGDYQFPANFYRAQFNQAGSIPEYFKSYDDFLIAGLEQKIMQIKATVLIIDNISCLRGGTESAAVALRLMNNLKRLKADHKLSILVLAHTPKRRNPARPINAEDLHGSKLLINFADSAFAIGKSTTEAGLCYIKQIKQRNTQQLYGESNVALCRITKTPTSPKKPANFLHFNFEGFGAEQPHIQIPGRHGYNRALANHQQLATQIAEMEAEGLSQRQIARQLNMAAGSVNKLAHQADSLQNDSATPPLPVIDVQFITNEDDIAIPPDEFPFMSPLAKSYPPRIEIINPRSRPLAGAGQPLPNAAVNTPPNNETITVACANAPPLNPDFASVTLPHTSACNCAHKLINCFNIMAALLVLDTHFISSLV